MKHLISLFLVILLLIPILLFSQEHAVKKYGKETKLRKTTPFQEVFKTPGKFKNREILIEGYVSSVCKTKGCWMEITDGKDKMRVKFEDYSFFVPWDSKGKRVKIQGKVNREKVKASTYKHWLEEAGEAKEVIEKIKRDQKVVIFTAAGVMMDSGSEISPEQQSSIDSAHKE
jgi:hypothetical protein